MISLHSSRLQTIPRLFYLKGNHVTLQNFCLDRVKGSKFETLIKLLLPHVPDMLWQARG